MKRWMLCAMLLFSLHAWAEDESADALTAEKTADIEELIDITGTMALSRQMSALVTAEYGRLVKQANPAVPDELLTTIVPIVDEVLEAHAEDFKRAVVVLYHRHFSHEEMKQMIAFYKTDLGKKTVRIMPTLIKESMQVGQKWGASLQPEIEQRIRARLKKENFDI
ncbi:DUF2059 domain-containing protein [Methylobacillus pratensis]